MIEVTELVKTYPNNVKALDGVSFTIKPGEVCGYLGANGAGKSTTIKIVTGMLSADSGKVTIGGIDVFKNSQQAKKIIGYVPESGALFQSLTPYDFLEFVCKMYGIEKETYAKRIYEFLEMFDLKNEVKTPIASFSKGMSQKVLIISSLIHNPEIIFWDEPLSGIDFKTTALIKDIVEDLSSHGKTFFYSTHVLDMMEKICSKVIILNEGKVVHDAEITNADGRVSIEEIFSKYVDTTTSKEKAAEIYKNMTN
jgi:ABC-2 type transport system ATP-binding protein